MSKSAVQHVRLGDLAEMASGWSSKRSEHDSVSMSVVLPRNVLPSGVVDTKDLQREDLPVGAARYAVQPRDVLLVSRGSTGAFRAGVVEEVLANTVITSNVMRVRLRQESLLAEVLVAFLLTPDAQTTLKGRSLGSATFSITLGQLEELRVPVPPMPTQQTLAALWRSTQRAYEAGIDAANARRDLGLGVIDSYLTTGSVPATFASEVRDGR